MFVLFKDLSFKTIILSLCHSIGCYSHFRLHLCTSPHSQDDKYKKRQSIKMLTPAIFLGDKNHPLYAFHNASLPDSSLTIHFNSQNKIILKLKVEVVNGNVLPWLRPNLSHRHPLHLRLWARRDNSRLALWPRLSSMLLLHHQLLSHLLLLL